MEWSEEWTGRVVDEAPLAAFVGGRIDWGVKPDIGAGDWLVFNIVADPRPDHFGGAQGFRRTHVQADAWSGHSADRAGRIIAALIEAVRPEPGSPGVGDDGSWETDNFRFDRPQIDGPVDGGEQLDTLYAHRARLDIFVWHAEKEGN